MRIIENEAFKDSQIKKLDISNCLLHEVRRLAFKGLERSLEMLDMSANRYVNWFDEKHCTASHYDVFSFSFRLKDLPDTLLDDFDMIKSLKLSDNMLRVSPNASFMGFKFSLKDLSLSGEDMGFVPLREVGLMRNIRKVGLPGIRYQGRVTESQFSPFAPGLEELNLVSANLVEIGK